MKWPKLTFALIVVIAAAMNAFVTFERVNPGDIGGTRKPVRAVLAAGVVFLMAIVIALGLVRSALNDHFGAPTRGGP